MMNFDQRYAQCIQKLYRRLDLTVNESWNKSLHLQLLQQSYSENLGSPASASVMWNPLLYNVHAQYFAYADDIVLLTRDFNTLNDILTQMENQATLAGLEINSEKTKYLTNLNSDVVGTNRILNEA